MLWTLIGILLLFWILGFIFENSWWPCSYLTSCCVDHLYL